VPALLPPLELVRGGGANGGVEGDVIGLAGGRARPDVAAALAVRARLGAAPAQAAGQTVERALDPAGSEDLTRSDLLPALPPMGFKGIEDRLPRRIRLTRLLGLVSALSI
jgi:hypothetical protein